MRADRSLLFVNVLMEALHVTVLDLVVQVGCGRVLVREKGTEQRGEQENSFSVSATTNERRRVGMCCP